MDGKITQIVLVVTDQTRSLEFFTEKVGFVKKTDVNAPGGSRWVTVAPKGEDIEIALWQTGSTVDPSQKVVSKNWSPGKSPPIILAVSDCRKAHQEMTARGVEFLMPPSDRPWGTTATFQDPDGNLFSLNQPPSSWPRQ
jgi:predicted enzyme related to lactoylglutathione lyase